MWEDSPAGWPQLRKGKQVTRNPVTMTPRPAVPRLKAGYSDDLGTGRP